MQNKHQDQSADAHEPGESCLPPGPPPDPDILKYHKIYHQLKEQAEHILPRGSRLPDLEANSLAGGRASLAAFWQERPLVLVTACLSCGQARRWLEGLVELARRHHDRANFLLFYTLEAHPEGSRSPYSDGEWISAKNSAANIHCIQPETLEARLALAGTLLAQLGGTLQCLVDDMDNAGWQALGGAPNMGLLIDRHGIVVEKQGWFHPPDMERALLALLAG